MNKFYSFNFLGGIAEINKQIAKINQKLDIIMATQAEAAAKLTAAADKLSKAQAEILAEIDELKASGVELTPEVLAAVDRIEQLATALDEIVADTESPA